METLLKRKKARESSKPKDNVTRLLFEDSTKMRAFNKIFMDNIGLAMVTPQVRGSLVGRGINITKVGSTNE